MEHLASLKRRPDEIDFDKCILCQEEDKSSTLRNPGPQGLKTLRECARERLKFKDKNRQCIDRILFYDHEKACYHKSCNSIFTSKAIISRLKSTKKKRVMSQLLHIFTVVCQSLYGICAFSVKKRKQMI